MGGMLSSSGSNSTALQRVASVKLAMPKRRASRKPDIGADQPGDEGGGRGERAAAPLPPSPPSHALIVSSIPDDNPLPAPPPKPKNYGDSEDAYSSRHTSAANAYSEPAPQEQGLASEEPESEEAAAPPRKKSFLHLSSPFASKPAEPPPPVPGGYLVFSPVSDGSLFLHYSDTPVEGAILAFRPRKTIPQFKFRQNGGRVEIIRKLQANKQAYYEGVSQFIKTGALDFDSDIQLIGDTCLVYWIEGTIIHQLIKGTWADTRPMTCVASLPPGNVSFRGVKTITRDQFVSISNKAGNGKAIILH